MSTPYDIIIVGARCAGSPSAMLLARKGYRTLVVDRDTFPSDTLSSHVVHPRGVEALARWGLLEKLVATGCPPIDTYSFDFGPVTISGSPGVPQCPVAYCPRRTVLDKLLVDAAAEVGAEIREGFAVAEILMEDGRVVGIAGRGRDGRRVTERARVVIGADGWHSVVAQAVRPERYRERPPLTAAYYSYWRDLPVGARFEIHMRPNRGFAAAPTHDGLTLVIGGWPSAEFTANKRDVEGHFLGMLERVPEFGERLHGAARVAPFAGASLPNYLRKPYGPGWVLVGDAGCIKDSVTAQGMTDAFHDAERCAHALDEVFDGGRSFDNALAAFQRDRDERVIPMYELTCQIASMEPPPPEMQQLLAAVQGNREAMDGFVRMNAGTIPPAAFLAPQNVSAIMAAAQVPAGDFGVRPR